MIDTLYKEEILEHFHDPQNFGELKEFTNTSKQLNPFCGDEIEMFILLNNNVVKDVRFMGKGCAISIAGASMLTQEIKGKIVEEVKIFSEKNMLELLEVEISETRKKCALLALAVLKDCI